MSSEWQQPQRFEPREWEHSFREALVDLFCKGLALNLHPIVSISSRCPNKLTFQVTHTLTTPSYGSLHLLPTCIHKNPIYGKSLKALFMELNIPEVCFYCRSQENGCGD